MMSKKNTINKRRSCNKGGVFYMRYTEEMERELYTLISSLPNTLKQRWVKPNSIELKHTKCLMFNKDGISFEISVSTSLSLEYRYHSKFYYRHYSYTHHNVTSKPLWYINGSLGYYLPQDILEMIGIACNLHIEFYTDAVIDEMKELAREYNLFYVGVGFGDAEDDKLTEMYIHNHHIEDDRFGLTYYFINYVSQDALGELDVEDWDEDDEFLDDYH